MNELQRQHYLSALGVDTYMPRWVMPFAPVSLECQLPALQHSDEKIISTLEQSAVTENQPVAESRLIVEEKLVVATPNISTSVSINQLMETIFDDKKSKKIIRDAALQIATHLPKVTSVALEPFSLSVWKPLEGVVIIDERNTKLALPTELLLNNILAKVFPAQNFQMRAEVLRWPMIENRMVKLTTEDARIELQTWLSVQHEVQPIKQLWLMGTNTAQYFFSAESSLNAFSSSQLSVTPINALLLPNLNELLQDPPKKQQLSSAIFRYNQLFT